MSCEGAMRWLAFFLSCSVGKEMWGPGYHIPSMVQRGMRSEVAPVLTRCRGASGIHQSHESIKEEPTRTNSPGAMRGHVGVSMLGSLIGWSCREMKDTQTNPVGIPISGRTTVKNRVKKHMLWMGRPNSAKVGWGGCCQNDGPLFGPPLEAYTPK